MKKMMKQTLAGIALFALAGTASAETIVQFNFDDDTKNPSTEATDVSSTAIGDWEPASNIQKDGPGLYGNVDRWQVQVKNQADDVAATFVLTLAAGKQLAISNFTYVVKGPADLTVAYSTDGSTFTDIGSDSATSSYETHTITPASAITGLEGDVTIRMTVAKASLADYASFFHDDVTINGSLSATQVAGTVVIIK